MKITTTFLKQITNLFTLTKTYLNYRENETIEYRIKIIKTFKETSKVTQAKQLSFLFILNFIKFITKFSTIKKTVIIQENLRLNP